MITWNLDPTNCTQEQLERLLDVVESIDSPLSVKALPSIEHVTAWCYPPKVSGMGISLREKILYLLFRLREMPGLHSVIKIIPPRWQRNIKRRLSHRPIHDVVNDLVTR